MSRRLVSRNTSRLLLLGCFLRSSRYNLWFFKITRRLIFHKLLKKFTLFHSSYFRNYSRGYRRLILLLLLAFFRHRQFFKSSKSCLTLSRWHIIILLQSLRCWNLLVKLRLININFLSHYDPWYFFLLCLYTHILKLIIWNHWVFSVSIHYSSRCNGSLKIL